MRAATRRQHIDHLPGPWLGTNVHGRWLKFCATLHMSANNHKSTVTSDFGVTQEFGQAGKLMNIECVNNEDWLSMPGPGQYA